MTNDLHDGSVGPEDDAPETPLADHIVTFGRVLRRAGFDVGSSQMMDALHAVHLVGVQRRGDVYQALYSVFVRDPGQVELFDQAFRLFWQVPSEGPDLLAEMLSSFDAGPAETPRQRVLRALQEPKDRPQEPTRPRDDEEGEQVEVVASYSSAETLKQKDFADFSPEEVAEAKAFMQRMEWPVEPQRVRRSTPRAKGRVLDMRRTLRRALKHHGEVLHLRRLGPKRRHRPIVVLCDVSGSMEPYARMLLHFMHSVTGKMQRVESFVFGTRLTRITRALQRRDVDEALDAVSEQVNDWAGGTRIGEALQTFSYEWLRRTLRSGGVVLIISDGCDRGDVDLLEREIARLARSCHRLLWLNPLLRYEGYEPLTRGMQAVLPHVDDLLPVHNLASLEQLGDALRRIGRRDGPSWPAMYDWKP